jgi:protein phosphatase
VSGWVFGTKTDVGLVRDGNEDSLYAGPRLLVVADGVGGSVAGEIASKIAVTALAPLDSDASITDPLTALREAVLQADSQLRDAIDRDPRLAGMGTTLTAILGAGDAVGLAQLGDSRAYLSRGGEMSQISRDHTLVQSLVDEGQITPEEALVHPRRSWILRALDGRGEAEPDLIPLTPIAGDRYLLCSDGLSDYVDESVIAATLADGSDPQQICDRLVELALQAGAPDNVTCIVAEPIQGDPPTTQPVVAGAAAAPDREPPAERHAAAERRTPREPRTGTGIGRRLAYVAGIVFVLVVAAVGGTAVYVRSQWYVAADQGNVAVYRGVQGSAVGVNLSRLEQLSNLPATALPQDDQDRLSNGIGASSRSGALSVVTSLRQEACALVTPSPSPTPTKSAIPHHHRRTPPRQPTKKSVLPSYCQSSTP